MFSFERILKRILKQKGFYLFFILQLVFGMTLVIYSMNGYFHQKHLFEQMSQDVSRELVSIESNPRVTQAITEEDYHRTKEKFKDQLSVYFSKHSTMHFSYSLAAGSFEGIVIPVHFVGDEAREELLGLGKEHGKYLMGSEVKKKLAMLSSLEPQEVGSGSIKPGHYFVEKEEGILPLEEGIEIKGKTYPFEDLPEEVGVKIYPSTSSVDLSESLTRGGQEGEEDKLKHALILPLDDELAEAEF